MSKHTPGPWVVTDTRDGGYPGIMRQVRDDKGNVAQCEQVYPFYACAQEDKDFPRHSADKLVMEAAPDLLAALTEAEKCIAALPKPSVKKDFRGLLHLEQTLKAVRAAITKATGEHLGNAGCDNCGTHDRAYGSKLCSYCAGSCPDDENNACDGYLGDVDELDAKPTIESIDRTIKHGSCRLVGFFSDNAERELFSYYIDELVFLDSDLIGLTEEEAHQLRQQRDISYSFRGTGLASR